MDRDLPRPFATPGLPSELLRAALDDAAPSDVRRGVLAALGMDVGANAGPVSTSSGVFEKGPSPSQRITAPSPPARSEPMTSSCAEQPVTLSCVGAQIRGAPRPSHLQPTELSPRHLHATSLLYLGAAAAAGALIAKAAHLGLSGGALSIALLGAALSGGALSVAELDSGPALTCDSRWASQGMMTGETSPSREVGITEEPGRAGERSRRAKARRMELRSASGPAHGQSGFREHPGSGRDAPGAGKNRSLTVDALARVASMRGTDTDTDTDAEDWLGEQLAILARAERSLLEDDPDATLRSFEDYRARFPQGLLDPQMAAVRQRAEQRFGAYIFP
jgi:hypothetical protein